MGFELAGLKEFLMLVEGKYVDGLAVHRYRCAVIVVFRLFFIVSYYKYTKFFRFSCHPIPIVIAGIMLKKSW